jgi:hypothetical protein
MKLPFGQLSGRPRLGDYFSQTSRIGIAMSSGNLLHILKIESIASPAELVATRILAEFAECSQRPELDYLAPEMIVLTASPRELSHIAEKMRRLLGEDRFAGWELVIYGG